ncbi:Phosphatidic acid phosphatase type 2/haloperoxidase [Trinorchestia longiramus]|nr:Phosphatidic acid phosphatase type 2/haloperoxidase [Trinorchestia longiramus]
MRNDYHFFISTIMSEDDIKWKPFSLTFVEYPEGDAIGKFLAIASLFPVGMLVGCFTLILFRRDLHTISFFIGNLLCEIVNLVLKNMIREPRPLVRAHQYSDYGMPSSHSQMVWFFAFYTIFFVLFRLHHNCESVFEVVWKASVIVGVVCVASVVVYSRVYLLYHSWAQVIIGSVLGALLGAGWFVVVHLYLTPFFPLVTSWWMCELLMVRDTSLIPNVLWFEYTQARSENRNRCRKFVSMKNQ